jgi:hypothetical protein
MTVLDSENEKELVIEVKENQDLKVAHLASG